jgi:hypothetical protein
VKSFEKPMLQVRINKSELMEVGGKGIALKRQTVPR